MRLSLLSLLCSHAFADVPTDAPTAAPTASPTTAPTATHTRVPTPHHCEVGTHYCWTDLSTSHFATCTAVVGGSEYTCEYPEVFFQTRVHLYHGVSVGWPELRQACEQAPTDILLRRHTRQRMESSNSLAKLSYRVLLQTRSCRYGKLSLKRVWRGNWVYIPLRLLSLVLATLLP
jgi:hypothetical protein